MELSFYTSPISQEIRVEGRAEGRVEGELLQAAASVLNVLEAREMEVSESVRERIIHCDDLDTLTRWLCRAVIAPTVEGIFASDTTDE